MNNQDYDSTGSAIRVVEDWHRALNDGDTDRLVALSHQDVEVGGPRGTGHGAQLLREWVERAGIHLEPGRMFFREGTVVVEQTAEWRSSDTDGAPTRQTAASIFVIRDGQIVRVIRYPDVTSALSAANLDKSHEVRTE